MQRPHLSHVYIPNEISQAGPKCCSVSRELLLLSASGQCKINWQPPNHTQHQSQAACPSLAQLGRQKIPQGKGRFTTPSAKTKNLGDGPCPGSAIACSLQNRVEPGSNTRKQTWEPRKEHSPSLAGRMGAEMPAVVTGGAEQGLSYSSAQGEPGHSPDPASSMGHLENFRR